MSASAVHYNKLSSSETSARFRTLYFTKPGQVVEQKKLDYMQHYGKVGIVISVLEDSHALVLW